MIFEGFKIAATPFIHDAYCKCGSYLTEVDNGWFSKAMYCPRCENVYVLKLVKLSNNRVPDKFLKQCREKVKKQTEKK